MPDGPADRVGAGDAAAVEATWLGQSGFALRAGGSRVLVDPFVSAHELRTAPGPDAERLAGAVDWLLVTHEHTDHLDLAFLPTLVRCSPAVRIVLPAPLAELVAPVVGAERLHPVTTGTRIALGPGLELEATPAWHDVGPGPPSLQTPPAASPRCAGYVLRTPGVCVYHAGDTVVSGELLRWLADRAVDVAMLPINGRDYFRTAAGLAGNMDAREAVGLAQRIGAHTLIPMHWDLMAGNRARPETVVEHAIDGDVHVLVPARMRPFRLA